MSKCEKVLFSTQSLSTVGSLEFYHSKRLILRFFIPFDFEDSAKKQTFHDAWTKKKRLPNEYTRENEFLYILRSFLRFQEMTLSLSSQGTSVDFYSIYKVRDEVMILEKLQAEINNFDFWIQKIAPLYYCTEEQFF